MLTMDWFRSSVGWALESNGHQVYHLNEVREDLFMEAIRVFQPDIFFDMGWDSEHVNRDNVLLISEITKRNNLFHVYFAEEDWLHYNDWSKWYTSVTAPEFVLTRSASCIPFYEAMGLQAAYFDVGCNPLFHRPRPAFPRWMCDVSVVANMQYYWDIFRRKAISDLIVPLFDQPYKTMIFGKDWANANQYFGISPQPGMYQGLLYYHHTPWVFSAAKINVSLQSVEDQISSRTYDILASGGFLLTADTPGVRNKLEPGIHCEVSASPKETLEKVAYYLEHDDERLRIAKAGLQYAREKASYQKNLDEIWPSIEAAFNKWKRGGLA